VSPLHGHDGPLASGSHVLEGIVIGGGSADSEGVIGRNGAGKLEEPNHAGSLVADQGADSVVTGGRSIGEVAGTFPLDQRPPAGKGIQRGV